LPVALKELLHPTPGTARRTTVLDEFSFPVRAVHLAARLREIGNPGDDM
jgi:hypothetical protein